jgi:protein TonB
MDGTRRRLIMEDRFFWSLRMPNPSQQRFTHILRRRTAIPWAEEEARDRLSSTLFLAGLLHGVILLGVTFTAGDILPRPESTSLEVVLITNEYEKRLAPADAELIAQQNMTGAGNTSEPMKLQTALSQTLETGRLGLEQTGDEKPQNLQRTELSEQPTIVAKSIQSSLAIPERQHELEQNVQRQQQTLAGESSAIEIINKPEPETLISDSQPRELIISANTREARIAAYLSKWKNRIERVGTLNYPNAASTAGSANFPTLEVAINADGELHEVLVRNSSGIQNLDRAAMKIVTMAAPFEPFPEFLRSEYDVLRFAYEWRFTEGQLSSTISLVSGI